MNEFDQESIRRLLKSSLPRIANIEPARDLWPEMLKRIEDGKSSRVRFGLLDWAIAGLIAVSIVLFPNLIPGLLYHL